MYFVSMHKYDWEVIAVCHDPSSMDVVITSKCKSILCYFLCYKTLDMYMYTDLYLHASRFWMSWKKMFIFVKAKPFSRTKVNAARQHYVTISMWQYRGNINAFVTKPQIPTELVLCLFMMECTYYIQSCRMTILPWPCLYFHGMC